MRAISRAGDATGRGSLSRCGCRRYPNTLEVLATGLASPEHPPPLRSRDPHSQLCNSSGTVELFVLCMRDANDSAAMRSGNLAKASPPRNGGFGIIRAAECVTRPLGEA